MSGGPGRGPRFPETLTISLSRRTILIVLVLIVAIWIALHLINVMVVVFSALLISAASHSATYACCATHTQLANVSE